MDGITWRGVYGEHMCVAADAAANCTVECVDNFSLLNLMDLIQTIRIRARTRPVGNIERL